MARRRKSSLVTNLFLIAGLFLAIYVGAQLVKGIVGAGSGGRLNIPQGKKGLLFLHMNGCGHCDRFMPEWDEFARTHKTTIVTMKIERSENPALMDKYQVKGFPMIILVSADGNKLDEFNGKRTKEALMTFAKQNQ